MKRILFITALCLMASITFAQKKAVRGATFELKSATPNIAEARTLIKGALEDPETKNQAETWYIAGAIENKAFEIEQEKDVNAEITKTKANEEVMYPALDAVLPYFKKAIELDRLPNEKGQVKPKYIKNIKNILKDTRRFYSNAGLYYYNKKDYQKAYENFKTYGDIVRLDIYDDKDRAKFNLVDTIEAQIRYNAGLMAQAAKNHQGAIELFEEIKNDGYSEEDVYQALASEYMALEDTAKFEKTCDDGLRKFPENTFFLLNMINAHTNKKEYAQAITLLENAIKKDTENAELYNVLGLVFDNDNNSEKAVENLTKAVELEPTNIKFNSNAGRVFFNLGVEARRKADETKDEALTKSLMQQQKEYYTKALPYYEKVFEDDSTNREAVYALFAIYDRLDRPEISKVDKIYKRLFEGGE